MSPYRLRRLAIVVILLVIAALPIASSDLPGSPIIDDSQSELSVKASQQLAELPTKGRAPKTGYGREQFGDGWSTATGCDVRNNVLRRDLKNVVTNQDCKVVSGTLNDPYTGRTIQFKRGALTSDDVQIDHVVALSNAWQTGAQQLDYSERVALANDPLNLLAVDGPANEQKSDSDAASWLPANKSFRCSYVSRQIAVKKKYGLWVTRPERDAMSRILSAC